MLQIEGGGEATSHPLFFVRSEDWAEGRAVKKEVQGAYGCNHVPLIVQGAVGSSCACDFLRDGISRNLVSRRPVVEHVHLNGFDRLSLAVHHATNSFRCVSTEHRFATVSADGCGDLLNPHGPAIDIKNFVHKFLTAYSFPAHNDSETWLSPPGVIIPSCRVRSGGAHCARGNGRRAWRLLSVRGQSESVFLRHAHFKIRPRI